LHQFHFHSIHYLVNEHRYLYKLYRSHEWNMFLVSRAANILCVWLWQCITEFPWINRIVHWNSVFHELLSIAWIPGTSPYTFAYLLSPLKCVKTKSNNCSEGVNKKW
jgi:hypothetical protein